ncbi:MAG: hypothetical protein ABL308_03345 [Oceanicaulis sp.]
MPRSALLILAVPAAFSLIACGDQGPPDTPLYEIDQSAAAAPADPRLDGEWRAVLDTTVDPRPLDLSIDLVTEPPSVVLRAPGQGGAAIVFDQVRLDGSEIAFATRLGAFRFEGALTGEDTIEGVLHQGGLRSPLVWRRDG